jgi:transcriptional regulator with PAS, ATPase and Fis domain
MPFPEWFGSGRNEAHFLRCVLDHVSDCLVAVDTSGRIVLINESYCRLLGGRAENFIGRHITEVVSPKSRLHLVAQGDAGVTVSTLEVKGHQLLARQVPVYQDEKIIGAVGLALFSDLDALKRAAEVFVKDSPAIRSPESLWVANYKIDDLSGQGEKIDLIHKQIHQAASLNLPVLISGETGTGKELAASAIHSLSSRAQRPFVWVNCASIPDNLIDAELFGYEGGAFTGARSRGKPGKFELASGGTLFLDEIGDMPLHLQASLLRAIQSQEIVRVGGTSPIKIDVRLICATNLSLEKMIREEKFRSDLYYRINVLSLKMPAVRERDDFNFLIDTLVDRLQSRINVPFRPITVQIRKHLKEYQWPGNVRELEAVLLRYLISGELPLSEIKKIQVDGEKNHNLSKTVTKTLQEHLDNEKMAYINQVINIFDGDKERAASLLGISRATLYRELKRQK